MKKERKNRAVVTFIWVVLQTSILWALPLASFGQESGINSKAAKDTIFRKRMPSELNKVPEQSVKQRSVQLIDENKRPLYPDNVKVKIITNNTTQVEYTREGKVDYDLKGDDYVVKVVVGRYKTHLGTHKRKVMELNAWEAAMKGVFVPVGKTKNFLGLKPICPKPVK